MVLPFRLPDTRWLLGMIAQLFVRCQSRMPPKQFDRTQENEIDVSSLPAFHSATDPVFSLRVCACSVPGAWPWDLSSSVATRWARSAWSTEVVSNTYCFEATPLSVARSVCVRRIKSRKRQQALLCVLRAEGRSRHGFWHWVIKKSIGACDFFFFSLYLNWGKRFPDLL